MGWTHYLLPIFFLGLIIWTHYILFVGDEREMMDWSKTEEFLKKWERMCDSSQCTCKQCYLYETVLNLCPKDLDYDFLCNAPDKSCLDCKIDYWLSEAK